MKVLVTGGTGFIGSTLVRHLLAAGHEVRVLVRQKKDSFLLENLSVEVSQGDVTSPQAVDQAVQGCSVVYHLASLYAFYPFWMKEPKAIYKINVAGTVHMLEASLRHGVKKFIHTSTIATIGARPDGRPSDEGTAFEARGASHYALSKYQAEQKVLEYFQKGLPAVILNPAVVIGERDHKPTPSGDVVVKFLNRKYPGYFDALWSVADADDVAKAHIAAAELGRPGERYILSGDRHYTLKETFQLLEKITGVRAPRLKVPYALLLAVTALDEVLSHFLFHKKPLMPTEGVRFSRSAVPYDNAKAVRELGYRPTPYEETLLKAVAWYRKNAYVEPRGTMRIKARGLRAVRTFMKALGMDKFTDKLNLGTLFFFAIVRFLEMLRKCGVARDTDGWRKVTRCYLRTEASKFVLAVFGLDPWSDRQDLPEVTEVAARRHLIARLGGFLKQYPVMHSRLEWGPFDARSRTKNTADIVEATFDGAGTLTAIEPCLDPGAENGRSGDMPAGTRELLARGILEAYNATRNAPDKKRPLLLQKAWARWLSSQCASLPGEGKKMAADYGARVLSAAWIRFEPSGADVLGGENTRFQAPNFLRSKHPGFAPLNIVCRFTPGFRAADLWIQFSHIPVDGVPAQEILNDLKKQWGTQGALAFPVSGYQEGMSPERCSSASEKAGVFHAYQFLDFRPFLEARNRLNRRFGRRAHRVISSGALLIWKLAQYPEFEDVKFALPVDLRAAGARGRTLGFIFIRPGMYFDRHRADRGFFAFQQEFNRQLFATRKRQSESYRLLEAYGAASPALFAATTRCLAGPLHEFTGTIGITIIKKADFFVAPASDVHTDGFIAFSNFVLPSRDGGQVGVVSMKGPREKVQKYTRVLHDVMNRAVRHDELYF